MRDVPKDLEARAYGPESTPEEIAAIQARVDLHSEDIILWREVPVITPFSIDLCCDRVIALHEAHGCRYVIVDMADGGRPDAAARKRLRERSLAFEGRIEHSTVVLTGNPLVKVAVRFIQAILPMKMTMHFSIAEAEAALRRSGAR